MIARLAVSIVATTALAWSGTSSAAMLRLQPLGVQRSAAVASAAHRTSAYLSAPGQLAVGLAGRASRFATVPVGCTPAAASAQAIGLTCLSTGLSVVYDLSLGSLTPLSFPSGESGTISDLGARWAMISAASSPDGEHTLATRLLLDWHSQQVVSLGRDDPYGASRYIDLDVADPGRRLCRPIRRRADGGIDNVKYLSLSRVGRWTLNTTALGGAFIQRCGTRATIRLPRAADPVLGNDFVGYLQGRRIVYLDLRTGKRRNRVWPAAQTPTLAAAGRRLIVSAPEQAVAYPPVQDPTYRIYRTR